MEQMRREISKLTTERDALLELNDSLNDKMEDLSIKVEALQDKVRHIPKLPEGGGSVVES